MLLALVALYAALTAAEVQQLPFGLGLAGVLAVAVALAARSSLLLPWGLGAVGGSYAVSLMLGGDTIDTAAPLVAAALVAAAELAYWSLELVASPAARELLGGRVATIATVGLGTAFVGLLLLGAAGSSAAGGLALDAAGILAVLAALVLIAGLARRA